LNFRYVANKGSNAIPLEFALKRLGLFTADKFAYTHGVERRGGELHDLYIVVSCGPHIFHLYLGVGRLLERAGDDIVSVGLDARTAGRRRRGVDISLRHCFIGQHRCGIRKRRGFAVYIYHGRAFDAGEDANFRAPVARVFGFCAGYAVMTVIARLAFAITYRPQAVAMDAVLHQILYYSVGPALAELFVVL
jgi:hypothetical protein